MSGISKCTTTPRTYGPTFKTRLDLMGARFLVPEAPADGGAGGGAGGDQGAGGDGAGGDAAKLVPQAEVDRILQDRLARQAKQFEGFETFKEKAERLDALEAEGQSDGQKTVEKLTSLENRATTAEATITERDTTIATLNTQLDRYRAAAAAGLDIAHAPRLQGSTLEELTADANEFKKSLGGRSYDPGQGQRDDGNGTVDAGRSAYQERHAKK